MIWSKILQNISDQSDKPVKMSNNCCKSFVQNTSNQIEMFSSFENFKIFWQDIKWDYWIEYSFSWQLINWIWLEYWLYSMCSIKLKEHLTFILKWNNLHMFELKSILPLNCCLDWCCLLFELCWDMLDTLLMLLFDL